MLNVQTFAGNVYNHHRKRKIETKILRVANSHSYLHEPGKPLVLNPRVEGAVGDRRGGRWGRRFDSLGGRGRGLVLGRVPR